MKKLTITSPQGLKFTDWAILVAEQLAFLGVGPPLSEDLWRDWACSLHYFPELATLPTPDGFQTWLAWAERASETTI